MLVYQRRMVWFGSFNKSPATLIAEGIEPNGYQFEAFGCQFFSEFLPHGQVTRASSVRRPGVNEHFFALQTRQFKDVSVKVRQA